MTFTNRLHFAAVVRDAIRRGTLISYERDLRLGRTATLSDGRVLTYEPAWRSMLRQEREKYEDDGREYADPRDFREEWL